MRFSQRHDVDPLVDEHGQVAPGVDPVGVHRADDRLAGRPDRQALLELLVAAVGDPGHLRGEPLDVLRLLGEVALRDEQREVHVLVAGALDHGVERVAGPLPEGEAVGADDHAALDRRVVGQLGAADHVDVPAVEVVGLRRDLLGAALVPPWRPSIGSAPWEPATPVPPSYTPAHRGGVEMRERLGFGPRPLRPAELDRSRSTAARPARHRGCVDGHRRDHRGQSRCGGRPLRARPWSDPGGRLGGDHPAELRAVHRAGVLPRHR